VVGAGARTLEEWFSTAKASPSDFHEHVQTLRELADQCESVAEIVAWGKPSTVALCASKAKRIESCSPNGDRPQWARLRELVGPRLQTTRPTDGNAIPVIPCDLLFVDTYHTGPTVYGQLKSNAESVRKYLVIHCTEIYGEAGDDGGPGVLHGIRQFLREHTEWTAIRHDANNYGLIVLSRLDEDRKRPPGLARKALNFLRAKTSHVLAGSVEVPDEVWEERVNTCMLCPNRALDACSLCGCPVNAKAKWAEQACPDTPPRWQAWPGQAAT
jgi:hypothetical protein